MLALSYDADRDLRMTSTYRNTLAVLSRFLSRVNAQLTLERALRRVDLTPESLADHHLASLLPQLERSLSLFVERARLPHLLAELGQQQSERKLVDRQITVVNEADLSEARVQARQVCMDLGVASLITQKVATLVSELARNIVLYAGQGHIDIHPQLAPVRRILVRAHDTGPGIANLPQILAGEYKSKTGLGMGLRGCKRLANRFEIDTGPWGTRIEAEITF
jgi:serine/threonine-protein kinase RsbT